MNLHEYQEKSFSSFGVAIQRGKLATTVDEAVTAFEKLKAETGTDFAVVKAQIHAGAEEKARCKTAKIWRN